MSTGHKENNYRIRLIGEPDNPAVAAIILGVMTEFDAIGCSYSSSDPEVDSMFEAYTAPDHVFFVVEQGGRVMGCGGMGPLAGGEATVCELRKMYFLPELRGTGMGGKLLGVILDSARKSGYNHCYLETLERMEGARRLYGRYGFQFIDAPMGNTGHSACNSWMVKNLTL